MTEQEAKTKWCPMVNARNVIPGRHMHGVFESKGGRTYDVCCIGTSCMMFRQRSYLLDIDGTSSGPTDDYYCGLAGKP
jgi:hypothetical protein